MTSTLSLRAVVAYASNLLAQLPLSLGTATPWTTFGSGNIHAVDGGRTYIPLSGAPSCPLDGPTSCHNNTPVTGDTCCFMYPSGRMLLTQFWDEEAHVDGGEEDWTVHGLWPDLCDGSFDSYCHMTPQFDNITAVLEHHGHQELLDSLNRYWVADRGSNAHLWAHEYNKHATCINTLAPSCYGEAYRAGFEVVDYFVRAMSLFKLLDTSLALERAGIVPAAKKHYPLVDVTKALEEFGGGKVVLRCKGRGHDVLHEAWYVYFVKGSLQSGEFVPAQHLGREAYAGNCAPWVRYIPKRRRYSS